MEIPDTCHLSDADFLTGFTHANRNPREVRYDQTLADRILAVLSAASLAAPSVGHAQTFKVEKFDIKGDGGTDYVAVEAATGRVFVSRANHMMVVEGATGKVLGDIPNTPGVHGAGIRHQGWSRLYDE